MKLIDSSASQIAEQLSVDPQYARAAAAKFARKIVRERINVDQIAHIAANELKSDASAGDAEKNPSPSISEDWLNVFESEAAQMSSEQMQILFGKILAGEIREPTSFSIKTVRLMSQLDNQAASLFRRLCSLSISLRIPGAKSGGGLHIFDARVPAFGNAASNSLQDFGLNFGALNILNEYGLIISDYNSYMDYQLSVVSEKRSGWPLTYQAEKWVFVPITVPQPGNELRIHGVSFSQAGKELLPVVEITPNEKYTSALNSFFERTGMTMTKLGPV